MKTFLLIWLLVHQRPVESSSLCRYSICENCLVSGCAWIEEVDGSEGCANRNMLEELPVVKIYDECSQKIEDAISIDLIDETTTGKDFMSSTGTFGEHTTILAELGGTFYKF